MEENQNDVIEGEIVSGALVEQQAELTPINLGQFQAWAEAREKALRMLMDIGISTTRSEDWADMGGKPHPEQGACTAMINMVGIVITAPSRRKETFEDELGSYYEYILEANTSIPKFGIGPIPIVGRCSSRDQFFAYKNKALRPASEIDPGDILGKAYTNLRFRAVKACVPDVAGMNWARLEELTKGRVKKGAVKQVHYGENGEEPAGEGNCPTCHKGNLVERKRKSDGSAFWACDAGKYDPKTKTRSGCQHIQNEPPAEPKPRETSEPASEQEPQASGGGDDIRKLMKQLNLSHEVLNKICLDEFGGKRGMAWGEQSPEVQTGLLNYLRSMAGEGDPAEGTPFENE